MFTVIVLQWPFSWF